MKTESQTITPSFIEILTAATKVVGVTPMEIPKGRSYKAVAARHITLALAMNYGLPREFLARWFGMNRQSLSPVRSLVADRLEVDRQSKEQYAETVLLVSQKAGQPTSENRAKA